MLRWLFRRKPAAPTEPPKERASWLTHLTGAVGFGRDMLGETLKDIEKSHMFHPVAADGATMDDSSTGVPQFKQLNMYRGDLPDALVGWFVSQTFIGYQMCALIAQHWLADKACTMPARDAIRHGFDIHVGGLEGDDTDEAESALVEKIREHDKRMRLHWNMEQFVRQGRIFGIRVLIFKVESDDLLYYEKPFNPDGVTAGSYKGFVQVDPYWCTPQMDVSSMADPTDMNFYEPTWWTIQGKRYHRTHLCIFRSSELPDILKPMYNFGGISIPQRIVERVYAAERTANEGPQLAMTKRLTVWKTDLAALYANQAQAAEHMTRFTEYRDNHGVKVVDMGDTMEQHDTGLADLDATIMTQYQLVAAAAHVPATKLLGTAPKGFNSTGEYDESSYHEELETVQTNDLTPLLDRHYMLLARSAIEPTENLAPGTLTINVDWAPVDSPTALEYATINKTNAETDNILTTIGAIDGMDARNRIKTDKNSGYTGLADPTVEDEQVDDIINKALGNDPTAQTPPADQNPAGLGGAA